MTLMPTSTDVFFGTFMLVMMLLSFGSLIISIIAIVDVWKSNATQESKLLWTLLAFFTGFIGAIIWFAVGKKQNK